MHTEPPAAESGRTAVALSILVISYNTRDLTIECLRSVYAETRATAFEVICVDNDSRDGSAAAIRNEFPDVHLLALSHNEGFAAANNRAARVARGEWLLLLNPDTLVLDRAIDRLVAFAEANPGHSIFGGRTLFGDRTLDPTSCWARPTPWSLFCRGTGLASVFRHTRWFDPESYGGWKRDSVREVDIVTGCFLLIRRGVWNDLDGFDPQFFMYAEEADLCLRARHRGLRALLCPDATIVHYGGRSETVVADKTVRLLRAQHQLLRRHWTASSYRFGRAMLTMWVATRRLFWSLVPGSKSTPRAAMYREVLARRSEWSLPPEMPGTALTEPVKR